MLFNAARSSLIGRAMTARRRAVPFHDRETRARIKRDRPTGREGVVSSFFGIEYGMRTEEAALPHGACGDGLSAP